VEDPLKAFRKYLFEQDYFPRVRPFPGVRDFALRLHAAHIRFALASSADKSELTAYKRIAEIEDLVDDETTASDMARSKPHPDIFSTALRRLGLPASKCLALGDTPYDAEAAGKAGVRTIGVTTGGWSHEELLAAGCIEVYRDVAELLDRFDESALVREGLRTGA
jgi:HAD superfamily hydrolase (TIGR01509 family)